MADEKKVLIIDDHFEMIEFLRSMVELSNKDYQVTAVPSAEEGWLELRRDQFDMMITDVRLPGMSGFDLVRRMHSHNMTVPIIMITAYSSEQGKQEASELGVRHYFSKPLDTDEVLTAIQEVLEGPIELPAETPAAAPMKLVDISLPTGVRKRMETLANDIRASQLMLATVHGQVLLDIGNIRQLDLPPIARILATGLQNDFQLADLLGSGSLSTIQYHSGDEMEVYTANVGPDYFLAIFFETATQRGRFGTIWVFAQRAIKDLLTLMPPLTDAPETAAAAPTAPPEPVAAATPPETPPREEMIISPPVQLAPDPAAESKSSVEPDYPDVAPGELADFLSMVDDAAASVDADSFWNDALTDEAADRPMRGMSLAEAQAQGLIDLGEDVPPAETELTLDLDGSGGDGDELPPLELDPIDADPDELAALFSGDESGDADLDAFWDAALDESDAGGSTRGMTLEEAQQQGLIPSQIDLDENGQ